MHEMPLVWLMHTLSQSTERSFDELVRAEYRTLPAASTRRWGSSEAAVAGEPLDPPKEIGVI